MKIIIHRGITSKKVKENSYIAIKRALNDHTTSGAEFDIRLTKDKKIVLSHNSIVNGMTIEKNNYQDIIKNSYLDTLDKILLLDTTKILLIDIKEKNNYKSLANTLLKELDNTNRNIYLMSFDKKIIKYLNKRTKLKKGLLSIYYQKNKYDFLTANYNFVSSKKIIKEKEKEIFLWTIDNTRELKKIANKYDTNSNVYAIVNKEEE